MPMSAPEQEPQTPVEERALIAEPVPPSRLSADLTVLRDQSVGKTLTAAGCGMGPALSSDVTTKLLALDEITEANCDVVFDPPWNQSMMSDAAKLQLGLY